MVGSLAMIIDLAAVDEADPRDQPRAVDVALVHAESGERADFQKRRAGVDEPATRSRARSLPRATWRSRAFGRAALGRGAPAQLELVDEPTPSGRVGLVLAALRAKRALHSRHRVRFP